MSRTRVQALTVCLVVAVIAFGLINQSPAGPAPRRGGTLRIANIGEPPTLDMSATTVGVTSIIGNAIYETLFAFDASWRPQPHLAESYTVSGDGLTYTFRLRRAVPFHSGKEMTSEDVVASLNHWGKVGSRGVTAFRSVDSVTASDKYTVVIKLKEPFAPLLAFLALPSSAAVIMPKEVADAAPAGPAREYVGTGPYRFSEWLPNRHIRLTRFIGYAPRSDAPSGYAGRREALADELIFYPVGSVATRIAGVQSGEFDIADQISTDSYAQLKNDPRVVPEVHPTGTWLVFFFNKQSGLMANVKLRQAVMAALDMGPIMQATIGNPDLYALRANLYPQGTTWYTEGGKQWYNQKNPDRAKQLMAEAGYKGETVRWITTQQFDWMFKSSTVAVDQLQKAGFKMDMQLYEWAGVIERRAKPAEWEIFTTGHGFVPDPSLIDVFSPTYPGWWDTPRKKDLFTQFNRATDLEARQRIWNSLHELVFTEAGWAKAGEFFSVQLRSRELTTYKAAGLTSIFWNVQAVK
ncbi:MAG: ABC transporter substrate-binding protein [bacterium]